MKYLLDTNICICVINQRPQEVEKHFQSLHAGDIGISSITVYELFYGAYKSSKVEQNCQALMRFFTPLDIVEFTFEDAVVCGKIRAELAKIGKPIGPMDIQIAAQALSRNAILVTNNRKEFKRIKGLTLEDWTKRTVN